MLIMTIWPIGHVCTARRRGIDVRYNLRLIVYTYGAAIGNYP